MLTPNDELLTLLRPPGSGIVTYSVSIPWISQVQKALYNVTSAEAAVAPWAAQLQNQVESAKGFFVGIPSDIGAAIRRGAATGPVGFRAACLELKLNFFTKLKEAGWLDVGDVLCHPYILSDDMLNEETFKRIQKEFWGKNVDFPVGPVNVVHKVIKTLRERFPEKPILAFGGDHSISYPIVRGIRETAPKASHIGILHFDAHTDLRTHRQGSLYNYATWAYHAYMLDQQAPIVQIGIRSSTQTKEYFQKKFKNIRQFWIDDCKVQNFEGLISEVLQVFQTNNIQKVYISVDVDAVDPQLIPCTGTPELNGLSVDFVNTIIRRVSKNIQIVSSDITEFAATIGSDEARLLSAKNIARIADQLFYAMQANHIEVSQNQNQNQNNKPTQASPS